jgi:hypothetical protein
VTTRPRWGVVIHAAAVVLLSAPFIWRVVTYSGPDADIGAGLLLLPILALGLPWTIPFVVDPYAYDGLAPVVWYSLVIGPAVVNVIIHALLTHLIRRNTARPRGDR